MMFFIPPAILAIEDEDDRSFMENLYRSYYRLMYHEIFTVTSDPVSYTHLTLPTNREV